MNPLDLLLLVLMGAAFWLLILRPAKLRRQAQAKLVASLAPGRRVMTAGGIFGTVVAVGTDRVRLEVAPGIVLELLPQAIAEVVPDVEPSSPADPLAAPDDASALTARPDVPADPDAPAGAPTSREGDRG